MATSRKQKPRALKTAGIGSFNPHVLNRAVSIEKMDSIIHFAERGYTRGQMSYQLNIHMSVLLDVLERNCIKTIE